jgi:DNA helicase IV
VIARAAREREQRVAYAQGVLDIAAGSRSGDADEVLSAADLLDAEDLADRHEARDHRTVAERAAADRTWAFGHVIVDEAQELSEMAWRLLERRCPSRSMTIVGDVAQTGSAAGTTSWGEVLTAPEALPTTLAEAVAVEAEFLGDGRLAVIVPDGRIEPLGAAVSGAVPAAFGDSPDLTSRVVVLGVRQAKGLEFDSVLIADPGAILAESPRGRNDLYVAMTRSTQRLGILHVEPVPAEIAVVPLCPDAFTL